MDVKSDSQYNLKKKEKNEEHFDMGDLPQEILDSEIVNDRQRKENKKKAANL